MSKPKNNLFKFFIFGLVIVFCMTLTGCRVSENLATKINEAYKNGTPYSYNDLIKRLGDTFDKDIEGTPTTATGEVFWYSGYGAGDKAREKFISDNTKGKKIKQLSVKFSNGYAIYAEYSEINGDKKDK